MNKIEICDRCNGFGLVTFEIGSHHSEYATGKCKKCNGSGRLEVTTITTRVPFEPSDNKSERI